MELIAAYRFNLVLLILSTIVLNGALAWATSISNSGGSGGTERQQTKASRLSDSAGLNIESDAAAGVPMMMAYYRQSLSPSYDTSDPNSAILDSASPVNQYRTIRSAGGNVGGGGGARDRSLPFYPAYRFGSIRLIPPYALQHLIASRFQNSDYPGKRMGSEFLGKKRSNPSSFSSFVGSESLQQPQFDSASSVFASSAMQKKMGSEFLGRRKRSV